MMEDALFALLKFCKGCEVDEIGIRPIAVEIGLGISDGLAAKPGSGAQALLNEASANDGKAKFSNSKLKNLASVSTTVHEPAVTMAA
jgi:hypothetical protein